MIVKIQLPMHSTENEPQALIYDQKRKIHTFTPITKELIERMGNQLKCYFHATFKNGQLSIGDRGEEQDW